MTLNFNKKFYNLKTIEKAIKAYRRLADFKVEENKNRIKVRIRNMDKEIKEILSDEFYNYVLAEMKKFF